MLELLGRTGRTLGELLAPYRSRYFISGELNSVVADPEAKLAEIRECYADGERSELDGISVDYGDWHFNVRACNTEPLLRLCLESLVSPAHMAAKRDEVLGCHERAVAARDPPAPDPHAVPVGRVNCYLIEDDPLTLVDVGPNSGRALDELERALAEHGRRVEDLERIVLTHQHMDHVGLVGVLARRSEAEVCTLDLLAPVVEEHAAAAERDDELAEALMLRHGIPRDVVTALRACRTPIAAGAARRPSPAALADGEELEWAGRRMRVLHRPGHSPSDTVFLDEASGVALGGDHLLARISSTPLIARPLGGRSGEPGSRPPAGAARVPGLARARRARRRSRRSSPGTATPCDDHVALIDERFALHERRAAKLARASSPSGRAPPTSSPRRCGATSRSRRRT